MTEQKNTTKDEKNATKKKVAAKKGTKPNPNTKKKIVAQKKTDNKSKPEPANKNAAETQARDDASYEQKVATVAEHLKDVADNASKTVADAAQSTVEATSEAKDTIVDKAKAAYDNIDTTEFHAAADEMGKKAADTAKKAGSAVKTGLANHGIDADKLGEALKKDAKGAATVVVGGAKFVSERFSSFVSKMDAKVNGDDKDEE